MTFCGFLGRTRYGGSVTRTTLANWMIRLGTQLQPLIHLMRDAQTNGFLIQADETRIQVLKEPERSSTSDKYMWVMKGGPPGQESILFDYDPSRGQEVPLRLLDGFQGYLQADGYSSYNPVAKAYGLTQLGCMDHARRKFKDAQKAEPKKKKGDKISKADVALSKISKLYKIEKEIKLLSVEEKYKKRQSRSKPLLEDLKAWVDKNREKSPKAKDSLIRTAMNYMHNQWEKLIVYCEDGRLSISNIAVENAIRPFVIGRKNWLFSDTPKEAHASGVIYSLIETAKHHGLDPYHYFREILPQLPYADTVEKLEVLLPWNIQDKNNSSID